MNLVSILIAACNAERWIGEAIESALRQTHNNVEVVVVDDGSTDETFGVARSFGRKHVHVFRQSNSGACIARNRAFDACKGDFVKFLDADDVLAPDAVRTQLNAINSHRNDRFVVPYGDGIATDENLRPLPPGSTKTPLREQAFSPDPVERIGALLSHNIQTSLPLHRRELLQAVGGFKPGLKRGQEYDLHLRLGLVGAHFLYVPHDCSYIRQHAAPTRITNTEPLLSHPAFMFSIHVDRRSMLEDALGKPLPAPIAKPLAESAWNHMRRLVQHGDEKAGWWYAEEALMLDPEMRYAPSMFRIMSKLWGPVRAEHLLTKIRKLRNRAE